MTRFGRLVIAVALVATLGAASACQRTVEVQTGTRTVDSQGRVISEDIHTLRVPQDAAGAYRINTITLAAPAAPSIATLYAEAQAAIAAGDLPLAQTKLLAVIAISPDYRNAKKQSDAIKKHKKVKADATPSTPSKPATSTASPTTTPPAKYLGADATALQVWTPDQLDGFNPVKLSFDSLSVSREYIPKSGNPAKSLVIVAEQYGTATEAKASLNYNVKQRYPNDSATFTSHGHAVYFGSDGRTFATLGFTDGAVMVALEASPDSGSPAAMRAVLEKALGQLP